MNRNPKLELTWIGKENRPKLEPRILLENLLRSYHAKHRVKDGDIFDNRLIFTYKPIDELVNQRGQQIVGKQFHLVNGEWRMQ
jgi:hypothetical protein